MREIRGHLDTMILATLAESEAHGYAVAQAIKGRSDGVFDLPRGRYTRRCTG